MKRERKKERRVKRVLGKTCESMAEVIKTCIQIAKTVYEHVDSAKSNKAQLTLIQADVKSCVEIVESKC